VQGLQDPVPSATSLLPGRADDELTSMSQRLGARLAQAGGNLPGHPVPKAPTTREMCPRCAAAKRVGKPVALSVNLPANHPEMRAFAERRLLQELRQLDLVRHQTIRSCPWCLYGALCPAEHTRACLQVEKAAGLDLHGTS
jgi:hypothetical protein